MFSGERKKLPWVLLLAVACHSGIAAAVKFEPGVGLGLEYTDNATLSPDDTVDDLIAATYVGARLSENEGRLQYDASAAFNKHNYTKDTYEDQRYFNLALGADWEMIKQRFNWFLRNYYNQRPVVASNSNTPDNIQDTNTFTFGANINLPVSQRQNFSLVPVYSQFYYETLNTDNRQYSIAANWNYSMFRLTSVGLSLSARNVDYMEQAINDTSFVTASAVLNGLSKRSNYAVNLGSTTVKRDNGQSTSGFSGFANLSAELSSRSTLIANASTSLTDTSSTALVPDDSFVNGNGDGVQVSTDVIRNSTASLTYNRDDVSLNSNIWLRYSKITYSDNPLDRVIRGAGARIGRPISGLLSTGAYISYNRTYQIDSGRLDESYVVGGNLNYMFSRKLHGLIDLKYRTKESTTVNQNFDEASVFGSLVYGFGNVKRPTRSGGF